MMKIFLNVLMLVFLTPLFGMGRLTENPLHLKVEIKNEPVQFRVYYDFKHQQNFENAEIWEEEMVLLAGKSRSLFLSYDKLKERYKNQVAAKDFYSIPREGEVFQMSINKLANSFEILYDVHQPHFIIQEHLGRFFYYEETIQNIEWELLDDQKEILGFTCRMAEGVFDERKWTVWYAEELAQPFGPWKLIGLPGLILEAESEDKTIHFIASALEGQDVESELFDNLLDFNHKKKLNNIELLDLFRSKKVTKGDFIKLKKQAQQDRSSFHRIQMQSILFKDGGVIDMGLDPIRNIKMPISNPLDKQLP